MEAIYLYVAFSYLFMACYMGGRNGHSMLLDLTLILVAPISLPCCLGGHIGIHLSDD